MVLLAAKHSFCCSLAFYQNPRKKQAKTLLESELQKWYFAFSRTSTEEVHALLEGCLKIFFVLYLMVFGGSQDQLWILRYCQSPLLSSRLRSEKVSLFWLLGYLRSRDSCGSYKAFVALSFHDAWTSWVLLIVEIQAFFCVLSCWNMGEQENNLSTEQPTRRSMHEKADRHKEGDKGDS